MGKQLSVLSETALDYRKMDTGFSVFPLSVEAYTGLCGFSHTPAYRSGREAAVLIFLCAAAHTDVNSEAAFPAGGFFFPDGADLIFPELSAGCLRGQPDFHCNQGQNHAYQIHAYGCAQLYTGGSGSEIRPFFPLLPALSYPFFRASGRHCITGNLPLDYACRVPDDGGSLSAVCL